MREQTPWCHTALRPKFFFLDARAIFPLGLWLLHWAWWTFSIALVSVALLIALERLGLPLSFAWCRLRALLVGPTRPSKRAGVLTRRLKYL
jgi:intracellular multiplication protein IcmT